MKMVSKTRMTELSNYDNSVILNIVMFKKLLCGKFRSHICVMVIFGTRALHRSIKICVYYQEKLLISRRQ